jgi:hypothetical protein
MVIRPEPGDWAMRRIRNIQIPNSRSIGRIQERIAGTTWLSWPRV